MKLDNSDFTDDLNLFHTHEQMKIKTTSVATASASVDPNILKGKTKNLKYNTKNTTPITLNGLTLEEVKTSTYLGSIIDEQGGPHADVKTGGLAKQGQHSYNLGTTGNQTNCQPTSNSESSIQTPKQFDCTELKLQ
ncbi:unnamed protein product [Schistosoma mattheei]|uniref:Uncharacterized protein n=1 Tax=Schistosoma mattheei TaxID=31246 RepID=A0A183PZR6_9TREM|nr:unnamed protein product [Schistosoma mattheei]